MKTFTAQFFSSLRKGFTLIELLVVIAVMGVLATIVLVAVDPNEQFNRAEDANRKQTVNTLGNAAAQYVTARATLTSPYLTENNSWITYLVNTGELKRVPPDPGTAPVQCYFTQPAGAGRENNFCYNFVSPNYTVYVPLESKAEDSNSAGTACGADYPYFIYDSSSGKTCKKCGTNTFVSVPGNLTTGCP